MLDPGSVAACVLLQGVLIFDALPELSLSALTKQTVDFDFNVHMTSALCQIFLLAIHLY